MHLALGLPVSFGDTTFASLDENPGHFNMAARMEHLEVRSNLLFHM